MKFTAKDCQQIETDGSRIVSIHPGAMVVRVHEARDVPYCYDASRYYVSVDLRFREFDLNRPFGWCGYTKSEATRYANDLAAKITQAVEAVNAAQSFTLNGRDLLIARQTARLSSITGRFCAEVVT